MVLEEAADVHFAFEVGLGAVDNIGEDSRISIPLDYSTVVFAAVFIELFPVQESCASCYGSWWDQL